MSFALYSPPAARDAPPRDTTKDTRATSTTTGHAAKVHQHHRHKAPHAAQRDGRAPHAARHQCKGHQRRKRDAPHGRATGGTKHRGHAARFVANGKTSTTGRHQRTPATRHHGGTRDAGRAQRYTAPPRRDGTPPRDTDGHTPPRLKRATETAGGRFVFVVRRLLVL